MNGSPGFEIGTLVWSFVTYGKIRCTRQWLISRYGVCVHTIGNLVSILSVNPSCDTDPGIFLARGSSRGTGSTV